ncbi:hypothetical protein EDB82DRAFT_544316 [Fusarium venenatum]|uniref:uncharacterized protein n=1 Tax=Fusarium venenatum TaxID=56646 RepID=UPI001D63F4F0|nr:hypothetical protein EDB82DRAFT_544316 [Fusarium venenatum]
MNNPSPKMDPAIAAQLVEKARSYGLHSCDYCQAVFIDLTSLALSSGEADDHGSRDVNELQSGMWDGSLSSAMRFCKFQFSQNIIAEAQFKCPLFEIELPVNQGDLELRYFTVGFNPIHYEISLANIRLDIRLPKVSIKDLMSLVPDLGTTGVPIHPCIRSDKTFSRAQELITKCLSEHEKCKKTGSAPSRLLDVTFSRTRLVNTKFMKDLVWVALSYCWGGPQHSQTTYLNLQDLYREIVLEDLPLTLRDAVYEETDNADQKRESDKDQELRKMAGIFSGTVLIIAASCASSADEDFLQDRQQYEPAISIPPIDGRAWTFQEQLLSSRMLSFTKQTMQWHCQFRDCNISQDEFHLLSSPADYLAAYDEGTWVELVQEYCHRDLSNLEDRPIAIAVVAETFATNTPNVTASDFVAGLWKNNILEELLWFPNRQGPRREMIGYCWGVEFEPTASLIGIDIDLADPHFVFGDVKRGRMRLREIISRHHTERMLPPRPDWTTWISS